MAAPVLLRYTPFVLFLWLACAGTNPGDDASAPAVDTDTPVCAEGEVADGAACVPAACGTGPFGAAVADAYVDPGAAAGGDGSLSAPFRSLADALEGDAPTLALAAGEHVGPFVLNPRDGRALVGRCADLVRLVATDDSTVLSLGRGAFSLSGLTVAPGGGYGIQVDSGATVDATDLTVTGARGAGVSVYDAAFSATHLTVEGTDALGSADDGFGVEVAYAYVALTDPILRENRLAQVLVYGTGSLQVDGGTIDDAVAGEDGFGAALRVERGGSAAVRGTSVTGSVGYAVMVDGAASVVTLSDVTVSDVTDADGEAVGVLAGGGATIVMEGGAVARVAGAGIGATDGSSVDVEGVSVTEAAHVNSTGLLAFTDALITCVDCRVSGQQVAGVWADSGGQVRLTGGEVAEIGPLAGSPGLQVMGEAVVEATGVTIRGTSGPGARADDGGTLRLYDCVFDENVGAGVVALGGSTAVVEDCAISATAVAAPVTYSFGVIAIDATVNVRRTSIDDVTGSGVAADGSDVTLDTVTVVGSDAASDGLGGYGMEFIGGEATVTDSSVSDLLGLGLLASDGAVVHVSRSTVERVVANPSMRSGPGVAAQLGGWITLEDAVVRECSPGLLTLDGGRIDATATTAEGNGFAGVIVAGGVVSLVDSTVVDGVVDPSTGGGVGVYVSDETAVGELVLERVTVGAHPLAAVWDTGAGRISVVDSDLTGGEGLERSGQWIQGNALFARGAGAGAITVTGTRLAESAVAVLLHDATATLSGTRWESNALDLVVQACGDAPVPDADGAATVSICPASDRLYAPLSWSFVLPEIKVVVE